MSAVEEFFVNSVARDLLNLVRGEKLGEGIGREVYEFAQDDSLVIKFELGGGSFQNIMEWETWHRVEHTVHARWFAPCVSISPCGSILLMKRTEPMPKNLEILEVPAFLTDLKRANFGMLDGLTVCHDYGVHLLMERGMTKRMRKADWYD